MQASTGELVLLGMCGAAFGSFVNVLAYRLPRRESIVKPRSRCIGCGNTIRSRDNIPIVSWVLLRGRCRDCGAAIPLRYPLVEAVTAALFVVLGVKFGREAALWPALALAVVLVAAAATDLEQRIIPNRLMAAGALLALVLWTIADPSRLPENLIAGAAAGGLLLVTAIAYPAGMGMGDVKLAAVMGLFLGAPGRPRAVHRIRGGRAGRHWRSWPRAARPPASRACRSRPSSRSAASSRCFSGRD